jgi:hypothetical protein
VTGWGGTPHTQGTRTVGEGARRSDGFRSSPLEGSPDRVQQAQEEIGRRRALAESAAPSPWQIVIDSHRFDREEVSVWSEAEHSYVTEDVSRAWMPNAAYIAANDPGRTSWPSSTPRRRCWSGTGLHRGRTTGSHPACSTTRRSHAPTPPLVLDIYAPEGRS